MKIQFTGKDSIRGALIYAAGDTIASLLLHEFLWTRLGGMMVIGATFYALEIPNYFRWIDTKVSGLQGFRQSMVKTGLAVLYFNPLWIARHLVFIRIFSGQMTEISWEILQISSWSFLVNVPISLGANYLIQNKIILKYQFLASAVFSALMAVYYAFSIVMF